MGKKTIKIAFHSICSQDFRERIKNYFPDNLIPKETNDYDYYFANETIYWNKENMKEFLSSKNDAVRIVSLGECIYPDLNIADYALVSRNSDVSSNRILYIPYGNLNIPFLFNSYSELDDSKKNLDSNEILKSKTKFCNFIYSNPNAHPTRDKLFYEISKYKKVDSLGSHLNNVDIIDTRFDSNWRKLSVQLKSPYKFSIAAENAVFPGYASEKIVTSMMANTIPIYFGDPKIAEQFNPKSFINVADYDTLEAVVNRIREIDQNDDLYCQIMSEPWRTPEQIEKFDEDTKNFYKKFSDIFEMDLEKAKCRPVGTWPNVIYPNFLISNSIQNISLKKYLTNWIKSKIWK